MVVRMNFLIKYCVMSLCFILFSPILFAATMSNTSDSQSVAGYWQTINSKTKKPSSIIQIEKNGQFYTGKIVKTFPSPGDTKISMCVGCTGNQKGKPVLGLTIIKGMVCGPKSCEHGTILDPRNGKVYHAHMHVINGGAKLKVRGYVGMPLFGKTVVWQRVSHQVMLK